jgi:lysophospholipase L1-like esterase
MNKNEDGRIDFEELMSFFIGVFTESLKTKIVCVGDSITEGCCSTYGNTYPKFLKDILTLNIDETEFEILNFGVGGRTAQITGDYPYVNEPYW